MENQIVFLSTWGTSRGGLSVDVTLLSKEQFFNEVDKWNEGIIEGKYYYYPTWRFAVIDGHRSRLFKSIAVGEFEKMFNEAERERLGKLLEYRKGEYPVFLKAIYLKYGYEGVVSE